MDHKTATITFHAAHNYGSMLQAYALQQTLLALGVENEIINFRPFSQLSMYPNPYTSPLFKRLRRRAVDLLIPGFTKKRLEKYDNFERFLSQRLILTKEINTEQALATELGKYDTYITGSDQCWNSTCHDFSWAYYLDFVKDGNKISYASSIGPDTRLLDTTRISTLLPSFSAISAREEGTAQTLSALTDKEIAIVPDPTLLLSASQWRSLAAETPLVDGNYILLYTPYIRDNVLDIAKAVHKATGWKIVVTKLLGLSDYKALRGLNVDFQTQAGPEQFLNLISHAACVVSGSFHAIVFSMIFRRPFLAVDGDRDNRMAHLLKKYSLEAQAVHPEDVSQKIQSLQSVDYTTFNDIIPAEQAKAIDYLKKSIGISTEND